MTVPLFTLQRDLDTRPFTFCDRAAQSDDQRFDGRENNRRRRWPSEDGLKRLSVFGVQGQMLAVIAIKCKRRVIALWIESEASNSTVLLPSGLATLRISASLREIRR